MDFQTPFTLFGQKGERKYLNRNERELFFQCTIDLPLDKKLFCQLLYYTGARISEVYELTVMQIDYVDKMVIVRSLKKRKDNVYRQIPLPDGILETLLVYQSIRIKKGHLERNPNNLWTFSPRTGSRVIKKVMISAEIKGIRASALGLRHGFAVHAVTKVPLTLVQKWMGHGHLSTTAIYLQVSGIEEREWAEKVWRNNI